MKVRYKAVLKSIPRHEEVGIIEDDNMSSLDDFEFFYSGKIETDMLHDHCLNKVSVISTKIE